MNFPPELSRRHLLRATAGAVGASVGGLPVSAHEDHTGGPVQVVPDAADGFAVAPFATMDYPIQVTFGPGSGDGPDLYAVTAGGTVKRFDTTWTEFGPVYDQVVVAADGFNLPQGLAFYDFDGDDPDESGGGGVGVGTGYDFDEAMLVTDTRPNEHTGRTDGVVVMLRNGERTPVVEGLPAGLHWANHLRIGPDRRLYIANGNATDHGQGDADVYPYSGAILAVDVAEVAADPAVLHWVDENGNQIPTHEIADHPRNEAFASKVDVVAWGFRNVFGVAFGPDGVPYTGMNGSQSPASQDVFFRLDDRGREANYGFPWCLNRGEPGATEDISMEPSPYFEDHDEPYFEDREAADGFDYRDCSNFHHADAIMGWYNCATGLDFPNPDGRFAFPDEYQGDSFVGECTALDASGLADRTVEEGVTTRNTSHKVTRVVTDDAGRPTEVRDFVTGLSAPTDVVFGPQGAMYVAVPEGIYRVQPTAATGAVDLPSQPGVGDDGEYVVQAIHPQFFPQVLVVPAGATVQWRGDPVLLAHTVTSAATVDDARNGNPDGEFDEPLLRNGTVERTFEEPGRWPYFCQPHYGMGMIGAIHVVERGH